VAPPTLRELESTPAAESVPLVLVEVEVVLTAESLPTPASVPFLGSPEMEKLAQETSPLDWTVWAEESEPAPVSREFLRLSEISN
jgi:hypothetical protein